MTGCIFGCQPVLGGLVAFAAVCVSGCFLDRAALTPLGCANASDCAVDEVCVDARCEPRPTRDGGADAGVDGGEDAATPPDAGRDGGPDAGPDAGPAHCRDGIANDGETDVDCGGAECAGCDACLRCTIGGDCASGVCDATSGTCEPVLDTVTEGGTTFNAFVRADGRILVAHYAPGAYNLAYDPAVPQQLTITGGAAATSGFAPDPCRASGHMSFSRFDPNGRGVTLECGTDYSAPTARFRADDLFTSFGGGTYGSTTSTADGEHPGWAAIAGVNANAGRGGAGMCGSSAGIRTGGIAYCDGAPSGWANHLVSLTIDPINVANSFVACAGRECRLGAPGTCPHIWVWVDP